MLPIVRHETQAMSTIQAGSFLVNEKQTIVSDIRVFLRKVWSYVVLEVSEPPPVRRRPLVANKTVLCGTNTLKTVRREFNEDGYGLNRIPFMVQNMVLKLRGFSEH